MIDALPEGWTWRSASVDHNAIIVPQATLEASTTITAVFDVVPGTLPDVTDPGSRPPFPVFRPTVVIARWVTDGTIYDPQATLAQIELAGPRVVRGELALSPAGQPRRRGSYLAFRNEISLVRGGGPTAVSSALPADAVTALDGWVAQKGLPGVRVEIGERQ